MNKKAIILGINGQDGSYIGECLLSKGYYVIGIGRQDKSKWIGESASFEYISLDLINTRELIEILNIKDPSIIYHAAAIHGSAGFNYENHWQEVHVVNTHITHAIMEYLRLQNFDCKFVYLSSSKVFETYSSFINESTRRKSDCIYTITKNAATDLIHYYRSHHNIKSSIVWTFNHESERRSSLYFINKLVKSLIISKYDSNANTRFSNLDFWCDWGSAKEFMKILIKISENHVGQDFILATGKQIFARDLVKDLFNKHGLDYLAHISEENVLKNASKPAIADISKLKNIVNEVPIISIHDLCDEMVRKYNFN
jgi:GDPmannose 4,6-dehydratase